MKNPWLLPEGIEEILPPKSWTLEKMCRNILDLYRSWGYELVFPPMLEYLESLLTGTGRDLELSTFKVIDQLSGHTMGVRADMTPQVARIDAHILKRDTPTRLCYLGTVLHTRVNGIGASRAPLQAGAELYGYAGIDSDLEIILLALETLRVAGCRMRDLHIDIGHAGLYRVLMQTIELTTDQEARLFAALQRKAIAELQQMLEGWHVPAKQARALRCLAECHGGKEVIAQARERLLPVAGATEEFLHELEQLDSQLTMRESDLNVHYDLAESRGHRYHTGVTFAAYYPGHGSELTIGGHYDGIGTAFGRARPATGFSLDLKPLLGLSADTHEMQHSRQRRIFAPAEDDPTLWQTLRTLRDAGEIVVAALPGQHADAHIMDCTHTLEEQDGAWVPVALP